MPNRTEFSWMTTDELIQYVEFRDKSTPLERELAMRLSASIHVIHDLTATPDVDTHEREVRFDNG